MKESLQKTLVIGISSAGNSKNICLALDYALSKGLKAALICASYPKIEGRYNKNAANNAKDHLKRLTEPKNLKRPLRHLRHFILPVGWIEKYWKE